MASSGKKKTTMAKLQRESRLRERRMEKDARKRARRDAATHPTSHVDAPPGEGDATEEVVSPDTADTADTADAPDPADADRPPAAISHQDDSSTG